MSIPFEQQHEQHGGDLLAEGSYGCVFDPPLKCIKKNKKVLVHNHKYNHKVGKITDATIAKKEYSITEHLSEFPNATDYFIISEELCIPVSRAKQVEKDIINCEFVKDKLLPNTAQLIMPFGGRPLRLVSKTTKYIDFIKLGQHLLEAGSILLLQKVVHRDLHPMNILLTLKSKCKLIDFGVAWRPELLTMSNLNKQFMEFDPRFIQEPPESTYVNGMVANIPEHTIFARIHDEKSVLRLIEKVFGYPRSAMMNDLKKFIKNSISLQDKNWYAYYKLYWFKVDAWALGAVLLTLYVDLTFSDSFELEDKQKYLKIIKGMCEIDPIKRLDCIEALQLWTNKSHLLEREDVKSWLKEQDMYRNKLN